MLLNEMPYFECDVEVMMQNSRKVKLKARCPHCMSGVGLRDSVAVWDAITCRECGTLLEVTNLHPLTLDYAEGDALDDDDWDDDD